MKKKNILNVLMVLIVIAVAAGGLLAVNRLKGGNAAKSELSISEKKGVVTVEHNGIAYEMNDETNIVSGDIIRTGIGSQISVNVQDKGTVILSENTEVKFTEAERTELTVMKGEVFAALDSANTVIRVPQGEIYVSDSVLDVTVYPVADTVFVYSGAIMTGDELSVKAGQSAEYHQIENVSAVPEIKSLALSDLSDRQIDRLIKNSAETEICFSQSELLQLKADRKSEKEQAQQSLLKGEETAQQYVTLEIVCSTILDNMDSLSKGKEAYVPEDGVILKTSQISFTEGETVFDVLKRACEITDIHLEYSYTPLYESYYIEGINQLYEFDCGPESGWNYKVNGWFPNYGCSSYMIEEGDAIVWCYTCKGLGADIGAKISE